MSARGWLTSSCTALANASICTGPRRVAETSARANWEGTEMSVRRMSRATMMAVLIVVVSLTPAGFASADSGNGTQVIKINFCEPFFNTDLTVCYDTHLVSDGTETPSGNLSITYNYRYDITLRGPGCNQDLQGRESGHILYRQEELQEQGFTAQSTNSFDCAGQAEHCMFSQHFHYASGAFQPGWVEVICPES